MIFINGIFILLFLIISAWLLSKFFFRAAANLKEKERKENNYRQDLLNAVSEIRDSLITNDEDPLIYTDMLLNANKEWIQKQEIQGAIEKELGVNMNI